MDFGFCRMSKISLTDFPKRWHLTIMRQLKSLRSFWLSHFSHINMTRQNDTKIFITCGCVLNYTTSQRNSSDMDANVDLKRLFCKNPLMIYSFCKKWKINLFYWQYFFKFSWYLLKLFIREALYIWLIN